MSIEKPLKNPYRDHVEAQEHRIGALEADLKEKEKELKKYETPPMPPLKEGEVLNPTDKRLHNNIINGWCDIENRSKNKRNVGLFNCGEARLTVIKNEEDRILVRLNNKGRGEGGTSLSEGAEFYIKKEKFEKSWKANIMIEKIKEGEI